MKKQRISMFCLMLALAAKGQTPTTNASPSTVQFRPAGAQSIAQPPGTTLAVNSLNGIQTADFNTAAGDIGSKINAAFAACGGAAGKPVQSCVVNLVGDQTYSYATTIVIPNDSSAPWVTSPTLDCHNGTLRFTPASGEAFTVLGENAYKSGEIRNCRFMVGGAAATAHLWSRIDFAVSHSFFQMGATGLTFINDKAHGGPGYTEQQHWSDIQISVDGNRCGLTFTQDPSIYGNRSVGSFFYNSFEGVHFDLSGNGAKGVCLADNPAEPVVMFGSHWDINVNSGGDVALFWLGNASAITRGSVTVRGENTGGGSALDVYVSTPSSTFDNFGMSYATGFAHGYGPHIAHANVIFRGGQSPIDNDIFKGAYGVSSSTAEIGGVNPGRACKGFSAGSFLFALADFDAAVNCYFEIGYRNTSDASPDVDIAGNSGKPFTSLLWTDNFSKGVGIGPGFGKTVTPKSTLEVIGTASVRNRSLGTATDGGVTASRSIDPATGDLLDTFIGGTAGKPSNHYKQQFRDYATSATVTGLDCYSNKAVLCNVPNLTIGGSATALKGLQGTGDRAATATGSFTPGNLRRTDNNGTEIDAGVSPVLAASLTTTAAASDAVNIPGMTPGGHCGLTAASASAAANAATTWIGVKSAGRLVVNHAPVAGMAYDVICTGY